MSDNLVPTFAVVVPAHNSARTLARATQSVLEQVDSDLSLVIVDDGSTDDTLRIAQQVAASDDRVRVVSQSNCGTGAARNAGVAATRSKYLVFLDSDDVMLPEYLSVQRLFMESHRGFDIYSCLAYELVDGARGTLWRSQAAVAVPTTYELDDFLEGNPVFAASVVRRTAFELIGGFRSERYAEDYDLWVRMIAQGSRQITNPVPLVEYSMEPGKSARRDAEFLSMAETLDLLADSEDTPRVRSEACRNAAAVLRSRASRWQIERRALDGEPAALREITSRERAAYRNGCNYVVARFLGRGFPKAYLALVKRAKPRIAGSAR